MCQGESKRVAFPYNPVPLRQLAENHWDVMGLIRLARQQGCISCVGISDKGQG